MKACGKTQRLSSKVSAMNLPPAASNKVLSGASHLKKLLENLPLPPQPPEAGLKSDPKKCRPLKNGVDRKIGEVRQITKGCRKNIKTFL